MNNGVAQLVTNEGIWRELLRVRANTDPNVPIFYLEALESQLRFELNVIKLIKLDSRQELQH